MRAKIVEKKDLQSCRASAFAKTYEITF